MKRPNRASGPGLGLGHRALCTGQAQAQWPRPRLQSFSPKPCPGQSLGICPTCMMPGMPHAFLIRLPWILQGSGHLKLSEDPSRQFPDHWKRCQTKQNLQNPSKSTNMARFRLRIRLFESHSHFLSIGKPPRSPNPTKIEQDRPVLDLHTVTPSGEIPLPGQMGSRHVYISTMVVCHMCNV